MKNMALGILCLRAESDTRCSRRAGTPGMRPADPQRQPLETLVRNAEPRARSRQGWAPSACSQMPSGSVACSGLAPALEPERWFRIPKPVRIPAARRSLCDDRDCPCGRWGPPRVACFAPLPRGSVSAGKVQEPISGAWWAFLKGKFNQLSSSDQNQSISQSINPKQNTHTVKSINPSKNKYCLLVSPRIDEPPSDWAVKAFPKYMLLAFSL